MLTPGSKEIELRLVEEIRRNRETEMVYPRGVELLRVKSQLNPFVGRIGAIEAMVAWGR